MSSAPNDDSLVCALDLGGTNLRAANIDRDGKIHDRFRAATPKSERPNDVVNAIAGAVEDCDAAAAKRGARVESVSVVVPGSVHADTGVIVNAPNLSSIVGFKLGEALNAKLKRYVLIENDANAAALGEMWQGAARGFRMVICLTLGTGVGSGIIIDGKLLRGVSGSAGEIGHMSIDPFAGIKCECGNTGCLEVCASATAIVRMAREGLSENKDSSLASLTGNELTAKRVSEAARDGDRFSLYLFQQVGLYLGVALASLVNIFNPEIIVIGGGVSAAYDLFAPIMQAELLKRAFPVPAQLCRIAQAQCGDDAGLSGAAWLALQSHSR